MIIFSVVLYDFMTCVLLLIMIALVIKIRNVLWLLTFATVVTSVFRYYGYAK